MRRMAPVWMLILAMNVAGCSTFGKKSQTKPAAPPPQQPQGSGNWGDPPTAGQDPLASGPRVPPGVSGILAGRVLDNYDRIPPASYIQVIPAQQGGTKVAPIEVAADNQGYFTVLGLQPGQHYQLIARTKDGEPKLSATVWATPPNPRLLIHVSEDFATPSTPPAPAFPGQKKAAGDQGSASDGNNPVKPSNINGPASRGAELGAPVRIEDGSSQAAPPSGVHPERTTAGDVQVGRAVPVTIPPQGREPQRQPEQVVQLGTQALNGAPARARIPSCVLTGKQLDNFALYDSNGQPWEFRQNRRGKLVLIDFWGSWCMPCLHAAYHLRNLQERYGQAGLEVIGIAYEYEAPFQEQVRKVRNVRDRIGINYTLLMGSDMYICPVKTQFGVTSFPTLFLVDENNRVIWRSGPDRINELEALIQQRLRVR